MISANPGDRVRVVAVRLAVLAAQLTLLDAHHAPTTATALLIASGITRPGRRWPGSSSTC